ncbi:hypothetical protein [Streptomyces sp. NPDC051636]
MNRFVANFVIRMAVPIWSLALPPLATSTLSTGCPPVSAMICS